MQLSLLVFMLICHFESLMQQADTPLFALKQL